MIHVSIYRSLACIKATLKLRYFRNSFFFIIFILPRSDDVTAKLDFVSREASATRARIPIDPAGPEVTLRIDSAVCRRPSILGGPRGTLGAGEVSWSERARPTGAISVSSVDPVEGFFLLGFWTDCH